MELSTLLSSSYQRHAALGTSSCSAKSAVGANAALERVIVALSAGLSARGIQAGDRVAFLLPDSPELVFINLAFCKLGVVSALLKVRLTDQEPAYRLNH